MTSDVLDKQTGDRAGPAEIGAEASNRSRERTTEFVTRHALLVFFVLAFVITWAPTPFGVFMAAGPLLSALIVTAVVDGRQGLRSLGSRLVRWRVGWHWYAAALLIPLAVVLGTGGLDVALGAPASPIRQLELSSLVLVFAVRLVVPIFSPLGEEPGWRGFALPRLLARRTPLEATLFLGIIVAVWHVPLIWIAGEDLPPIFLLATVAVTFFYTWLFVHSGGSVLITILAHSTEGTIGREFTGTNGFVGADKTHWILLYTAGWCVVAVGLILFDRRLWLGSPERSAARVVVTPAVQPTG
jgi:uncharacterized protein